MVLRWIYGWMNPLLDEQFLSVMLEVGDKDLFFVTKAGRGGGLPSSLTSRAIFDPIWELECSPIAPFRDLFLSKMVIGRCLG